jgi:hypothetical protein
MIAYLARVVASIFSVKVFAGGLMMTIIGVVLYNLMVTTVQEVLNFALTKINGVSVSGVSSPTITGFAGWFLAQVKLPECFAVIVSCVSIKFALKKIPFLKW